jgi:hypothetical protein
MSIENQTETAKLTSDLTGARDQVIALQDRLSRMEMLFLQQATGVASEKLSSNVLRSLSGINNSLSHQLASELTEEHSSLYDSANSTGPVDGADEDIARQNIIEDAIQAHVSSGDAMSPDEVVRVLRLTRESGEGMAARLLSTQGPEDVKTVAMSIQLQEALRISNEIFEEKFDLAHSGSKQNLNSRVSEVDLSRMLTPRGTQTALTSSKAERELYASGPPALWVPLLLGHADELLGVLSPTAEALASRHKVFEYVRSIVSSTLGVQLYPTGSFVSHTFLPDGDVDTTAFVLKNDDDSWFVRVNEALCMSAFNQVGGAQSSKNSSFDTNPETSELLERSAASNPPVTISNVSFVNAEIKMIKSMIDSVSVDISVNQISALYAQAFIEKVDAFVGHEHLFKRSILLTKAWCQYESPRHTHGSGSLAGARDGRISSWAQAVMLTWVFNAEGRDIRHPLQALGHFLRIFSSFDWDSFALTVRGPVSASDLSEVPAHNRKRPEDLYLPAEVTDSFLIRSEETRKMSCFPSAAASTHSSSSTASPAAVMGDDSISLASVSMETASVAPSISPKPHGVSSWATRSAFPEVDCVYQQGLLSIMDPVAPTGCCCLTRALDAQGFEAITSALREGYKHFQSMCDAFSALPAKLSASSASPESVHSEVAKAAKVFLLNTSSRVTALTQSISRNLARVSGGSTAPVEDCLRAQTDELDVRLLNRF